MTAEQILERITELVTRQPGIESDDTLTQTPEEAIGWEALAHWVRLLLNGRPMEGIGAEVIDYVETTDAWTEYERRNGKHAAPGVSPLTRMGTVTPRG